MMNIRRKKSDVRQLRQVGSDKYIQLLLREGEMIMRQKSGRHYRVY